VVSFSVSFNKLNVCDPVFPFPSSTNKRMTYVDVTPPSPNASSYLPAVLNGYLTFVTSIISTAVIGDVSGHLGRLINPNDGVNAIAFVALGTSVPGITCSPKTRIIKSKLKLYLFYLFTLGRGAKMYFFLQFPPKMCKKWVN
jgi:hypothetical protein